MAAPSLLQRRPCLSPTFPVTRWRLEKSPLSGEFCYIFKIQGSDITFPALCSSRFNTMHYMYSHKNASSIPYYWHDVLSTVNVVYITVYLWFYFIYFVTVHSTVFAYSLRYWFLFTAYVTGFLFTVYDNFFIYSLYYSLYLQFTDSHCQPCPAICP